MPTKSLEKLQLRKGVPNKTHEFVLRQLNARKKYWKRQSRNNKTYRDLDDMFTAYLPETAEAALSKAKRQVGEQVYVDIQIPYIYAEVMTMHTYFSSVLLSRSPIHQFSAHSGSNQQKKLAIEALISYQMLNGKNTLPLYIWLLDALKYGRGILGVFWEDRYSYITKTQETSIIVPGGYEAQSFSEEVQEGHLKYSGNRYFNVHPSTFIFDPSVPGSHIQEGEFCGRTLQLSWNELLRGEKEGTFINARFARMAAKAGKLQRANEGHEEDSGSDIQLPNSDFDASMENFGNADAYELAVVLVPNDWDLGSGTYPEKWIFTVVDDKYVVEARPQGALHDEFQYVVYEPEFDGYSLYSRAPGEIIRPMEDVMNWLVNSHMYNVRKSLNNQFLVDPTMVEMADVLDPLPGGVMRKKPAAFGMKGDQVMSQFNVQDVTQTHLYDLRGILDMVQRIDGVNESMQGQIASGRTTATEIRQANTFGTSRLKVKTEMCSHGAMQPLGMLTLANSQQYLSQEQQLRVVGDLSAQMPFVDVTRDSIAGNYDYFPSDGSMPLDRFALANLWRNLFADATRLPPELAQRLDFMRIFEHAAKLGGATDITQFRVQAMDPEQLAMQAQRGNVVGLPGGQGGGVESGPTEGDESAASRLPASVGMQGVVAS